MNAAEIWQKIKPHAVRDLVGGGNSSATTTLGALTPHALSGPYHTGILAESQAPWAVTDSEFGAHTINPNAHHARAHDILASGDHAVTGGAALDVIGLSAPGVLARLTPSSSPGAASAVLKSSPAGNLTLPTFVAIDSIAIGVSAAESLLHIESPSAAVVNFLQLEGNRNAADTEVGILFKDRTAVAGGQQVARIYTDRSGSSGNFDLVFHGGSQINGGLSSEILRLQGQDGRVGILHSTPSFTLDVGGTGRFSSTLNLADGAASTPTLTFTGDTDTGFYRSGSDAFSLVAGGASVVNVGLTGAAINTPFDNTVALKAQSAVGSDVTAQFKRISGQTARIWRITDENDHDLIILDDEGNLESGNPGFVSGLTGWQITATGNAEFNNGFFRGELHSTIFVADEAHASSGTTIFATAGKLLNNANISDSTVILDIEDPAVGHAMIFRIGDRLRAKAIGTRDIFGSGRIYPSYPGAMTWAAASNSGISLMDIWLQVANITDMGTHWRYTCTRLSGSDGTLTAGTAIIRWGGVGDGLILATSDLNHAPYLDVFTSGIAPWAGDIYPHARFGRLTGIGVLNHNHVWGMVAGTNLADNTQPYVAASNGGVELYKVALTLSNGNPTVQMLPSGDVKFGRDVALPATTGFHFDPVTGNVAIGRYPDGQYLLWDQNAGLVTLAGTLIVDTPATINWSDIIGRPPDSAIYNNYTQISDIAGLDAISADYRDVVYASINVTVTGALTVTVDAGSTIRFRGGTYATKTLNTASVATLFTGYRTYVYVKGGNTNDNSVYATNTISTLGINDVLIGLVVGGAEKATWQSLWGKTIIGDNSIVTGAIQANHIKAGAITAEKLAVNSVTANAIETGSITASKLSVATLEAITTQTGALSVTGKLTFPALTIGNDLDYIRFASGATQRSWIGHKYSTGIIPETTDGLIFYNYDSTKFRFVGASSTEFDHNIFANAYYTNSDERLKSNIGLFENALDIIERINAYRYQMNNQWRLGVIAQDVQVVLPDAVTANGEYLAVDPMALLAALWAAVRELKAKCGY